MEIIRLDERPFVAARLGRQNGVGHTARRSIRSFRKYPKLMKGANCAEACRTMAILSQHAGSVKDIQTHLRHRTADVTAQEYMQPITDSARGMVNTVYDSLLNGK
jgi:hypothetical protein